ncbi:MAG: protein translocase subunit SecF [Clostridia bacterium]|nr:protein translocase subunit SecF [Clostridia bacterium]
MKKYKIDFVGKSKVFWLISIALMVIGLICTVLFPPELDIQFTGGSVFTYSFADDSVVIPETSSSDVSATDAAEDAAVVVSGADTVSGADASGVDLDAVLANVVPDQSRNVNPEEAAKVISAALGRNVTCQVNSRLNLSENDYDNKSIVISLTDKVALSHNADTIISKAMAAKYPNVKLTLKESNSVNPTMGKEFFGKCMVAVVLAALLMIVYIAIRFRKVGGWIAGLCGIVAILHDCAMVYIAFVIFNFPIDDNFIAVILAIVGYSINATIIIFDRIRENRGLLGPKATLADLTNKSVNETLGRTINTNVTLIFAIATVAVVASVFSLSSIMSFAIPMLFGVLSGAYSSVCIAPTLWTAWKGASDARKAD